ncbi:hypothetical protein NDU88_002677 [Pleurodeles waltl]|uniref:Uncharacterized protein n=1 Tax=Pleurodeles waltl TaxID=8319 RepID=A0AAV7UC76_PLEWA|nr:hypothetical protein NDU88_002677 [Pleurodeles waltl]
MQSAGHQQCSYGGNRGPNRGPPRSSLHQGPEFRPPPPPDSARSESTYYRPGPARTCRGPGNRKARKNSLVEGRKRPRGPASPAAAHTRSKQRKKGREPRPEAAADQAPRAPLHSRLLSPRPGAAAASLLSARTAGVSARGRPPAPGPSTQIQLPGARSSQTRLA